MSCSFIVMKSEDVMKLASECILHFKEWRAEELARRIILRRKEYEASLWVRLFGGMPTDEQIEEQLRSDLFVFLDVLNRGDANIEIAKKLILASKSSKEVHVSTTDLHAISLAD